MSEQDRDFIRSVTYFWLERGDPTRYVGWDEARCQRLMPEFYEAWRQSRTYTELANLAAAKYRGQTDA